MSLTNTLFPNEIDIRARKATFEEAWVKDVTSGEYTKLVPGGGGGGAELPYYLKANSIKVDAPGGGTNALIDENSVDVVNVTGNKSSSLQADRLIFGDSVDNKSLTKLGVDTVSRLQTMETSPVLNNGAGTLPLVYNPTTKDFSQTRSVSLLSADGVYRNNIGGTSFRNDVTNNPNRYFTAGLSTGFVHNETNYRIYTGAYSSGIIHRNLNNNKGIVAKEDSFTVGDVNGDAISSTGNYGKLTETSLTFKDSSGTFALNKADVGVTNKLKALTSATSGANSKMLIYDTATSAFNYTDIPSGSGGTVPSWVAPTQALFTQSISDGKDETTLDQTRLKVFSGSNFNDSTQVTIEDTNIDVRNTTSTTAGGIYKSLRIESNGVSLVDKKAGNPEVVTRILGGAMRAVVYADAFAHLTQNPTTKAFSIATGSPKCRQYAAAEGETLVLDCFGADTMGIHFNEWYAVNLGSQPGVTIIDGFITPAVSINNYGQLLITRNPTAITSGTVTIPPGSVIFKIVNTDVTGAVAFNGSLYLKLVSSNSSKLPDALFTDLTAAV